MAGRLRLARLDASRYTPVQETGAPTAAEHGRLVALIRRHLPPVTASLLAEPSPSPDGRTVDWHSDLAGQPEPLVDLPPAAQQHARDLLLNRLQSLADLADRLATGDPADADDAAALRVALNFPGEETVFVVGGQPVITFWGHRPVGTPVFVPATQAVAAASLAPDPAAGTIDRPPAGIGVTPPAGPGDAGSGHRRAWLWVLPVLLLLVAAPFLLHRLLGWGWRWPPWGPDFAALLGVAQDETRELQARDAALEELLAGRLAVCAAASDLAAAQIEGARLAGEIGALERRLQEELALCPQRHQLDAARAEGKDLAQQLATLERRLGASLAACRQRQAAAKREQEAEARRTVTAQQQQAQAPAPSPPPPVPARRPASTRPDGRPACPGERPPEEAPDIAIVLDASGSMRFPASIMAAQIEEELSRMGGIWELVGAAVLMGAGGSSRLEEAKRGINSVIDSLPGDVDIGMTVLQDCPSANNLGFFSPAQRDQLRARVAGLRPMQGTPLAEGVQQAGGMVDGVTTPGVIVVVSDGKDSCGGNPCAVARALKARKPLLTINVVDIIGNGAVNCMATATGGKVLQPGDGLAFERTIREAAAPAMKPDYCP